MNGLKGHDQKSPHLPVSTGLSGETRNKRQGQKRNCHRGATCTLTWKSKAVERSTCLSPGGLAGADWTPGGEEDLSLSRAMCLRRKTTVLTGRN